MCTSAEPGRDLVPNSKRHTLGVFLALGLALLALAAAGHAQQSGPKTSDITEVIASNGAVDMAFKMTFDAAPWRQWKAMVGDEPARLRTMLRHEFAAYTLEDFKLDRDDLDRVAKLSIHSPTGPQLRDDGSFQIPVEGYFRLINHAGADWYFSGNNPRAGYALNSVHITLPANAVNGYVTNPNSADQALVFALVAPPSPFRWFYIAGAIALVLGLLLLLLGALPRRQRVEILPPSTPRALPSSGAAAGYPLAGAGQLPTAGAAIEPAPVVNPPPQVQRVDPAPPPAGKTFVEPD
jgi:hypothetical protein